MAVDRRDHVQSKQYAEAEIEEQFNDFKDEARMAQRQQIIAGKLDPKTTRPTTSLKRYNELVARLEYLDADEQRKIREVRDQLAMKQTLEADTDRWMDISDLDQDLSY